LEKKHTGRYFGTEGNMMKISVLRAEHCPCGSWDASGIFNRETYEKNLLDFKLILDKYNVRFCLAFGTLLGAIRGDGFIEGDTDTDLLVAEEENERLSEAICSQEFRDAGFKVIRTIYDELITVSRNDAYIDVSVFSKKPDSDDLTTLNRHTIKEYMVREAQKITFLGQEFLIPKDVESYLTDKYGDWKTKSGRHATT
jgi:hypothetical protein